MKKNYSRYKILKYLKSKKIPCGVGSCPTIYKEKLFIDNAKYNVELNNAEYLGKVSICINIHHYMTKYEIKYINYHLNYILIKASSL